MCASDEVLHPPWPGLAMATICKQPQKSECLKAFQTYSKQILNIKLGTRVLREFKGIRVIHFYMAYQGVKSFRGSTSRKMFGCGMYTLGHVCSICLKIGRRISLINMP